VEGSFRQRIDALERSADRIPGEINNVVICKWGDCVLSERSRGLSLHSIALRGHSNLEARVLASLGIRLGGLLLASIGSAVGAILPLSYRKRTLFGGLLSVLAFLAALAQNYSAVLRPDRSWIREPRRRWTCEDADVEIRCPGASFAHGSSSAGRERKCSDCSASRAPTPDRSLIWRLLTDFYTRPAAGPVIELWVERECVGHKSGGDEPLSSIK